MKNYLNTLRENFIKSNRFTLWAKKKNYNLLLKFYTDDSDFRIQIKYPLGKITKEKANEAAESIADIISWNVGYYCVAPYEKITLFISNIPKDIALFVYDCPFECGKLYDNNIYSKISVEELIGNIKERAKILPPTDSDVNFYCDDFYVEEAI